MWFLVLFFRQGLTPLLYVARNSLCRPRRPGIHKDQPPSASPLLELWMWATTPLYLSETDCVYVVQTGLLFVNLLVSLLSAGVAGDLKVFLFLCLFV